MSPEPVVAIDALELPDGQHEAFREGWERARDYLSTQDQRREAHDIARGSARAL